MNLLDYTLPEEQDYIRYVSKGLPVFAPGELCKVQNYGVAREQGFYGWHLHHRMGYIRKDAEGMSRNELILNNLYYARPAEELLFVRKEDHVKLHSGVSFSMDCYDAPSDLYLEKLRRYRGLLRAINDAVVLEQDDIDFVKEFCRRTGRDVPSISRDYKFRCIGMTAYRCQLANRLISMGIGDLPNRLLQQEMLVNFLKDIGEYTLSNKRAIERILKGNSSCMKVMVLQGYSEKERRALCNNMVADNRKLEARHRAQALVAKINAGQRLTGAERTFKSRHKDLFEQ